MLRKIKQVAGHSGPGRKNLILLNYFVTILQFFRVFILELFAC